MKTQIPEAYLDLVNGPPVAALTTVMPDGQPQTTVVWCNFDGRHVLVNTMRGFRKEKNMRLNPKVTLLCYDPRQPLRSLEVRGTVVEMTEVGALDHLDGLCGPDLPKPIRVALVVDPAGHSTAKQVQEGVRKAARALEDAGYVVEEVEPPSIDVAAIEERVGIITPIDPT